MILVIDYGMGNIYSLMSALRFIGCEAIYTNDSEKIKKASKIILPGVGSFAMAMKAIQERKIDQLILEAVEVQKKPILGICLGMQLMTQYSDEDSGAKGLGLVNAVVKKFATSTNLVNKKVPHVGFSTVEITKPTLLYRGLKEFVDYYFSHSYRVVNLDNSHITGIAKNTDDFIASYQQNNIYGTQYHPELSQSNGLQVLKNFIEYT